MYMGEQLLTQSEKEIHKTSLYQEKKWLRDTINACMEGTHKEDSLLRMLEDVRRTADAWKKNVLSEEAYSSCLAKEGLCGTDESRYAQAALKFEAAGRTLDTLDHALLSGELQCMVEEMERQMDSFELAGYIHHLVQMWKGLWREKVRLVQLLKERPQTIQVFQLYLQVRWSIHLTELVDPGLDVFRLENHCVLDKTLDGAVVYVRIGQNMYGMHVPSSVPVGLLMLELDSVDEEKYLMEKIREGRAAPGGPAQRGYLFEDTSAKDKRQMIASVLDPLKARISACGMLGENGKRIADLYDRLLRVQEEVACCPAEPSCASWYMIWKINYYRFNGWGYAVYDQEETTEEASCCMYEISRCSPFDAEGRAACSLLEDLDRLRSFYERVYDKDPRKMDASVYGKREVNLYPMIYKKLEKLLARDPEAGRSILETCTEKYQSGYEYSISRPVRLTRSSMEDPVTGDVLLRLLPGIRADWLYGILKVMPL